MEYQKPSEGIALISEAKQYKMYRINCDCGDNEHDVFIDVESEDRFVNVTHYVNVTSPYWETRTKFYWLNRIIHCFKITWEVWRHGQVKYNATILLNEQTALNFSETIKHAIEDIKKAKENERKT
jgi:hypothetical protein